MAEKTSRTERDSNLVERMFGDHHHTTTISDGNNRVRGEARTSEESQRIASEKWDRKYGNEDKKY